MIDTCRLSTNTVPYLRSIRKEASSKLPHMSSISELTKGKSAASPYISRLKDVFVQTFRVFTARPAAVDPIIAPCFSPWGEVRMEDMSWHYIDTVPMDPSTFKYFGVWSQGLGTHSECMCVCIYIYRIHEFQHILGMKKISQERFFAVSSYDFPRQSAAQGRTHRALGSKDPPIA